MAMCVIKIFYPNSENWQVGDLVEISNPTKLIEEGKVELYVPELEVTETIFVGEAKPTKKTIKKQNKKSGKK